MRFRLSILLLFLAGVCSAQDTNFPIGPQYLGTTGSPILLRPIATPSLSFSSAIPDPYANGTELAPSQVSSATAASDTFLGEVYWGEHKPDEIVALRLVTPSLSPEQTAFYTYATANEASTPLPSPPTVPVGIPAVTNAIEITSAEMPANVPASLFDPGVSATATAGSLSVRGYGISLGEFARSLKSRKRPASHVFTNEDLHHGK